MPKKEELRDQISSLASEVIVNRPNDLIKEMKNGIQSTHIEEFWKKLTITKINRAYKIQDPTNENR